MNQFIELTQFNNKKKILIAIDSISAIMDEHSYCKVVNDYDTDKLVKVAESFDDIKVKLGLAIIPRAETIARI